MSVLPIVDRELRVAARRPGTYWMRFWAALAVLGIWLVLLTRSQYVSPAQMGQHLLNALGILALTFSMLAGVFLTSDCLSEEKREGTLGLLFLTDLKAYDVVLGKLAANSLHAFFGLLAIFPILGLALLVGGVTGLEFARLMLVFIVTLFFSLSMGMVVSAVSREAKQAVMNAFLAVLIFAGAFPAIWWLQWLVLKKPGLDFLLWPSPAYTYLEGFAVYYNSPYGAHEFWCSMGTLFGLAVGGIIFANLVLPRSWQERAPKPLAKERIQVDGEYSHDATRVFRATLRWFEPMYWLAVRDGAPRRAAKRLLLILVPLWFGILLTSLLISPTRNREMAFVTALFTAYALHMVVKVLIATEAGRRMNQDRRSGAWELLLATPMPVDTILRGQRRALQNHFRGAIITLLLVNATMAATVLIFPKLLDMRERDQFIFFEIFVGGMVALGTDFYALIWVGMWRGLKNRQHHRGVMAALGQVMLTPPLIVFFLIFLQPRINDDELTLFIAGWFSGGVIISILSGTAARLRLQKEFRNAVLGAHHTEAGPVAGGPTA